jgi:hypothetical protein
MGKLDSCNHRHITHYLGEKSLSNNVGGVKQFSSTLLYALIKERHFALEDGLRISNLGSL